jgi:hypothetical protein
MIRDDLSSNLVHLTRGETDAQAAERFVSIFSSKTLKGSNRDIRGGYKCVCFSEAPVAKLATILATPEQQAMRYKPFGVMVSKRWIFDKGGRPVVYQPNSEFELLAESQRFRHVRYEPGVTDYCWEREWRLQAEELKLEPDEVTLVVPTRAWEKWALVQHDRANRIANILLQGLAPTASFEWHFVVLEDIGVRIPAAPPPP